MRRFVGIYLGQESVSNETMICKFRHILETHNLGERFFRLTMKYLAENRMKVASGVIAVPGSTKNSDKASDSEIRQTKKGNEWHFCMKANIGVDKRTKQIHSVVATVATPAICTTAMPCPACFMVTT